MIPLIKMIASSSTTAHVVCPGGGSCDTGLPKVNATSHQLQEILALLFAIVAVIAVLMIIIGALMFITSGGNSDNATKARETILYAVIGLVVALFAEGVVAFVLGSVK